MRLLLLIFLLSFPWSVQAAAIGILNNDQAQPLRNAQLIATAQSPAPMSRALREMNAFSNLRAAEGALTNREIRHSPRPNPLLTSFRMPEHARNRVLSNPTPHAEIYKVPVAPVLIPFALSFFLLGMQGAWRGRIPRRYKRASLRVAKRTPQAIRQALYSGFRPASPGTP